MRLLWTGPSEDIAQRTTAKGTIIARRSKAAEDPCWDDFLQNTNVGQFQQSTVWARGKEPGGWKPIRLVMTLHDEIVGGFQILHRSKWWGGIGYLSKGPVIAAECPEAADFATDVIRDVCRSERLRVLVIQPPDLCQQMPSRLERRGFELDVLAKVNLATWVIDLRGGFSVVEQGMESEARRNVRQAVKRGVTMREGGQQDLKSFYELMLSTCRRQKVAPHPANVEELFSLWSAAEKAGYLRLYFADYERRPLTGLIDIGFGKTLTSWKKGWTSTESQRNPNDLSTYEALKWATQNGYHWYDFAAFDRRMAFAILRGEPLSDAQRRSRYMFFKRFGGGPRLLPESRVYFSNQIGRLAYRAVFRKKLQRAEKDCKIARVLSERELGSSPNSNNAKTRSMTA